jgi:anaerobic magnesium-protoporphyrin IX monomethyl ester cyclase
MMLAVLVCHSYFLRLDEKQSLRAKPYPPLATLQVVDMLRKAGHRVEFFDSMLADGMGDYDRLLQDAKPQLVLFYEDNFNYLSKMCLGAMRQAACGMIDAAVRAGARVIAAGADVTDAPEPYLQAGADLVLIGEGVSGLLDVLPRLDADPALDATALTQDVGGVACLIEGKVRTACTPKAPASMADMGLAAWDLVDVERYRAVWTRSHGYFSLNMAASRGCSFRCTWCAKPIWGNQYLQRSAADVAGEMLHLKSTYRPDHIWFADDIFGFRVDWVEEFAARVREQDAGIPFTIQIRADLISERMARALRDAGCREAWIGAESGSQRVLDAMNKGTTVADLQVARQRLKDAGIRVGFFIQLGYLGEQLADILATRELIETTQPDEIGVSVSYPLPGTKFHELVKAQIGGKSRWHESNDLEMMFHGTYTSQFYRAVRNLLHEEIDVQGLERGDASRSPVAARASLQRRWQELLATEFRHRTPVPSTASRDAGARPLGEAGARLLVTQA